MSFQLLKDATGTALPPEQQLVDERIRRLRELVARFRDAGVTPVHENCMNYGGMGWAMTQHLLDAVPGLSLVFDTGNPVFADDFTKPPPRPKQDAWEFYQHVRPHIAHIHVKDGHWNTARNACDFCFPGEGEGRVREILADLKAGGYDGGIAIEPHMGHVFHEPGQPSTDPERLRAGFVEYGRRLQRLWD